MSTANDFLTFGTDPSAPVLSQAAYATTVPALGFPPGIVPKEKFNKAMRQANVMAHTVGAFIQQQGFDAHDDTNLAVLLANLTSALQSLINTAVTPTTVLNLLNLSWVNFDGSTGTPTIRHSVGNFGSIERLGTGFYRFHFATPQAGTNYAAFGNCTLTLGNDTGFVTLYGGLTTSYFDFQCRNDDGGIGDCETVCIQVLGSGA